jgi:hypothetical protein
MQPHGSDRVRVSGGKVILHSRLAKGWTPRTPPSGTHSEFPGTTVLWDDHYYEVLSADPLPAGGVRYELAEWREDHTIRVFSVYDDASEARLVADHETAARQRARSRTASLSSMLLGHLPERAQARLANELGLFPARMTILSTIPTVVLLAVCVLLHVDARMRFIPSPIPTWLWFFAIVMIGDSGVRFHTAMLQNRGVGSLLGTLLYGIYEMLARKQAPAAEEKRTPLRLPDDPERDLLDSVKMRSWMVTLLPAREQRIVAERYGYDYRKEAYGFAWALLVVGAIGVGVSFPEKMIASIVGAGIVVEQALRLYAFRRGPAGSVFGIFVRPFVRDLLRT